MKLAILGLALAAVIAMAGCGAQQDIWLKGPISDRIRALTRHEGAIALSDKLRIYATENPPDAQVLCHEHEHSRQARVITDALVILKAIDDDDISRAAAWLALYSVEFAQYQYGNRYELAAKAACP